MPSEAEVKLSAKEICPDCSAPRWTNPDCNGACAEPPADDILSSSSSRPSAEDADKPMDCAAARRLTGGGSAYCDRCAAGEYEQCRYMVRAKSAVRPDVAGLIDDIDEAIAEQADQPPPLSLLTRCRSMIEYQNRALDSGVRRMHEAQTERANMEIRLAKSERQLAEYRADAERLAFIRERFCGGFKDRNISLNFNRWPDTSIYIGDLDKTIDAARSCATTPSPRVGHPPRR